MIKTERVDAEWLFCEKDFPFDSLVLLFLGGGIVGIFWCTKVIQFPHVVHKTAFSSVDVVDSTFWHGFFRFL